MSVFQTTGIRHPDSTTNDLFISSTGNIGIGTDNPQQLLHLASTNPRIRIDDTDSGGYYTELRQGGSATYLHLDGANIGSGNFRITADGGSEIFRFNDKGNVSIEGSTTSFDANPTVDGLQLYYETDTRLATIASYDGTSGSEISIGTNNGTADVVEAIRIKSDGNIGIGTSNPTGKLEIAGNNSSQIIQFGDGTRAGYFISRTDVDRGSADAAIHIHDFKWSGTSVARIKALTGDDTTNKDNGILTFETNSGAAVSERMRIDSSGNVGIGTTSPTTLLEIQSSGSGNGAGPVYSLMRNSATPAASDRLGAIHFDGKDSLDSRVTYKSVYAQIDSTTSGSAAGSLVIGSDDTNANQQVIITGSGNVGIGTSSPGVQLEVAGTGSPTFRISDSDGTNQFGQILANNGTFVIESRNDTSDGQIIFRGRNSVGTNEYGRFDENGNVGIGASSPQSKLHVVGDSIFVSGTGNGTVNIVSSANATNAGNKIAFFGADRFDTDEEMAYIKPLLVNNSGGSGNIQTGHLTFGTSGTEKMRISSNGDVGIGTSSPSATLHISSDNAGTALRLSHTDVASYYSFGRDSSGNIRILDSTNGEIIRIQPSGNVGIGTNSVQEKLHVREGNIVIGQSSGNATNIRNYIKFGRDANPKAAIGFLNNQTNGRGNLLFMNSIVSDGNEFTDAEEVMRIDSSGNVGIGTNSPGRALHVVNSASIVARFESTGTNFGGIELKDGNTTADFKVEITSVGDSLKFDAGGNERMRIASGGKVGIGETSPLGNLHVKSGDSGVSSVGASADEFVIEGSGHTGMTIVSGTTSQGLINFADSNDVNVGMIKYDHNSNFLLFRANDSDRMRITSNGGLLVATTNATPGLGDSDSGMSYEFNGGALFVSRASNDTCVFLNKNSGSNSGNYIDFNKAGSLVGSISHNGSGNVSYNNFQGSHLGRLVDRSTPDIKVGTLIEVTGTPLDYKCVPFTYTDDNGETQKMRKPWTGTEVVGTTVSFDWNGTSYSGVVTDENAENGYEKSLYTQVCATAASKAVLGVFMCWDDDTKRLYTDSYNDMMVTSVGNFVVRMASGQAPVIGDLFESDANGCAVVQTDDIIRSKTIGKITSTEKQVVYDDGSFLVTCVLYSG